jgi:hypothetical protein
LSFWLASEGLDTEPAPGTVCCYALQDKVWAHDPDGLPWEYYTVLEHIETPRPPCSRRSPPRRTHGPAT